MIKTIKILSSVIMGIVLGLSVLFSSVEAKVFSEDTVSDLQPLILFEPFGIFNPNHTYLDEGINSIMQPSSETKATITSKTYASQTVDSIGTIVTLQRWTGSEWIDVGTPVERSTTNKDSYTTSVTWNLSCQDASLGAARHYI